MDLSLIWLWLNGVVLVLLLVIGDEIEVIVYIVLDFSCSVKVGLDGMF